MPWTATVQSLVQSGNEVEVQAKFSDGDETTDFQQSVRTDGTKADLLVKLQGVIAAKEARAKDAIALGEVLDATPVKEPPFVDPNPEKTQWLQDYSKLQFLQAQLKRGVETGVLKPDDSAFAKAIGDQAVLVKATFDPSYQDGL